MTSTTTSRTARLLLSTTIVTVVADYLGAIHTRPSGGKLNERLLRDVRFEWDEDASEAKLIGWDAANHRVDIYCDQIIGMRGATLNEVGQLV